MTSCQPGTSTGLSTRAEARLSPPEERHRSSVGIEPECVVLRSRRSLPGLTYHVLPGAPATWIQPDLHGRTVFGVQRWSVENEEFVIRAVERDRSVAARRRLLSEAGIPSEQSYDGGRRFFRL